MTTSTTEAVLGHHLEGIVATNVDMIMEDYADDAVLFTLDGTYKGKDDLHAFFTEFVKALTPEFLAAFSLDKQDVSGNYAYISWHVGDAVPLGSDTFTIIDGKIAMQSLAMHATG